MPYDPALEAAINGQPAPVSAQALNAGPTFEITGTETAVYASDSGFVTGAGDDPSHTSFPARLIQPLRTQARLFNGAEPDGRSSATAGDIVVANGDGDMDTWLTYAWDGRSVQILAGDRDDAFADFGVIFDATAAGITWDEGEIAIRLRDRRELFDVQIPAARYAGTGGREGGGDLAGQPKPLAFGTVRNIRPLPINASALVYQVHDGTVRAIDAVRDQGVALTAAGDVSSVFSTTVSGGKFITELSSGLFRIGSSPNGTVTADVQGDATGGHVSTTAAIARRIATSRIGSNALTDSDVDLDTGSFTNLDLAQPATIGLYVDSLRNAGAVLDDLLAGIGGFWFFNRAGQMAVGRLLEPTVSDATLTERDVDALERIATETPIWKWSLGHRRVWQVQRDDDLAGSVSATDREFYEQDLRVKSATDTTVRSRHRLARDRQADALIDLAADAQTEVDRLLALHGAERDRYRVSVPDARFGRFLGDTVTLDLDRFSLDRKFVIVGLEEEASRLETVWELWG